MKMMIDRDSLREKIIKDGDQEVEAGTMHPEAPANPRFSTLKAEKGNLYKVVDYLGNPKDGWYIVLQLEDTDKKFNFHHYDSRVVALQIEKVCEKMNLNDPVGITIFFRKTFKSHGMTDMLIQKEN